MADQINLYNVYQACEEGWMYNRNAVERMLQSRVPESDGKRHFPMVRSLQ